MAFPALLAQLVDGGDGRDPAAGHLDGVAVDVGGEHADVALRAGAQAGFAEQDGEGVGLLARGAACDPHAQGLGRVAVLEEGIEVIVGQGLEGVRVAKEPGHAEQQQSAGTAHLAAGGRTWMVPGCSASKPPAEAPMPIASAGGGEVSGAASTSDGSLGAGLAIGVAAAGPGPVSRPASGPASRPASSCACTVPASTSMELRVGSTRTARPGKGVLHQAA